MANDVNLSAARIVRAAINSTPGNGRKYAPVGALQSTRSPQTQALTTEMSPQKADGDKRLSWQKGAGRHDFIPTVKVNFRKQYSTGGSRTTRQVSTSGARPSTATELDVTYTGFREYPLEFTTLDLETLEPAARAYEAAESAGIALGDNEIAVLAEVRNEVLLTIDKDLLQPINTDCLTAIIAGVGTNRVTNSAVPKDVVLYETDGRLRKDLLKYLQNIKLKHSIGGKLIVLGGLTLVNYMGDAKIMGINSVGVDAKPMFDLLDIEWYYDPGVDALLGQDKILIIDPGSMAWQTILEHGAYGPVKQKKVAQTSFSTGSITISPFDSTTFTLPIDIRVREYDTEKYPFWVITPSSGLYGLFVRPAGFFANYDGWGTYTGIMSAKLLLTPPVTP